MHPRARVDDGAEKGSSDDQHTFHLFVRPKDENAEIWSGARSGVQAAQDVFNADEAGDVGDISTLLPRLIGREKEVFTDIGSPIRRRSAVSRFFGGSASHFARLSDALQPSRVSPLQPLMSELRVTKSAAELDCMRFAGRVSGAAFTDAMRKDYTTEKQLWADMAHAFQSGGLDGEAYVPVVAGGRNALGIHYVRNDSMLQAGDVVVVDAGGAYGGYITDITRVWPVTGTFTDPQRDMYCMILAVQRSCIDLCRQDADTSLDQLHRVAHDGLRDGLKRLGFDTARSAAMDVLFPHHVGHHIGLGVHDAPGVLRTNRLLENHCIAIEPGVYVPVDDERWPAAFRGLGMRIEDSVRIGRNRAEVLTASAVKEVGEIEA